MSDEIELSTIDELIPDDRNANRGTEFGTAKLEKSLRELGLGRSVLVDRNNRLIAGNKTTEAAAAIGIEKVRIIETAGDELIVVKRTDLDLDSKQGRELALADNQVGALKLDFDMEVVQDLSDELGIDLNSWGLAPFESLEEKSAADESSTDYKSQYGVIVMCKDEAQQQQAYEELKGRGFECKIVVT